MYNELKRAGIIATIKHRQYNFYHRVLKQNEEDALVKSFLHICRHSKIIQYYESLHCHHKEFNIRDRERRIMSSPASMPSYYRSLIDVTKIRNIYQSFLDDRKRCIISRWRLSCHRLFIETGRYTSPPTPRENRKCHLCKTFWKTNIMQFSSVHITSLLV